jgi:hypothetical protein
MVGRPVGVAMFNTTTFCPQGLFIIIIIIIIIINCNWVVTLWQ